MCTTKCSSIEHIKVSVYEVTDREGIKSRPNLKTKIVHRGIVYVIPTCSCGYWCSSFRLCKCIVKALVEVGNGEAILVPKNVHPYYLVQNHPCWPRSLEKAGRRDYEDLPQLSLDSRLSESSCRVLLIIGSSLLSQSVYYRFARDSV